MKVLVAGGSGFIGTRLVERLLQDGREVGIFDKARSARYPDLTTIGDVRDAEAVRRATEGIDVVFNLAAEHKDDVRPVSLYYEVNVDGMRNVTAACHANGVPALVFTSTVALYGLDAGVPDEESPVRPFNDYGKSKAQAEEVVRAWAAGGGRRRAVIIRPTVVFGEGNRGNVYNLIRQISSGHFVMVGPGTNRKSMSYVGNVAAFLATLAGDGDGGVTVVNYADTPDFTMKELVSTVRGTLGMGKGLPALPWWVGLSAGKAFDLLAAVTGRSFPFSSIRVRKFCAETRVSNARLVARGFVPPNTLEEAMARYLAAEFSAAK